MTIMTMRSNFLKLDAQLKKFGKTKCKFHKNRKGQKKSTVDCFHSSMSYGGISRNTDCELENCPRVLWGNEGK